MRRLLPCLLLPTTLMVMFASPAGAVVRTPAPTVTVVTGDTLWGIGVRTGRGWQELATWNHLSNPNLIYPGQVIQLPPAGYVASVALAASPVTDGDGDHDADRSDATSSATSVRAPAVSSSPVPPSSGWTGPWACIAAHESGGAAGTDTGNGYYGGLQFSLGTWYANGGTGNPADASIGAQENVANRVLQTQGWGAWPSTSALCGY